MVDISELNNFVTTRYVRKSTSVWYNFDTDLSSRFCLKNTNFTKCSTKQSKDLFKLWYRISRNFFNRFEQFCNHTIHMNVDFFVQPNFEQNTSTKFITIYKIPRKYTQNIILISSGYV